MILHAFGECAELELMYAALIRAAERWRGLRMTEFERRQLIANRNELDRAHAEQTAPRRERQTSPHPQFVIQHRVGIDLRELPASSFQGRGEVTEILVFALSILMRLPQAHPGPTAIAINEFDAGSFQSAANGQVVGGRH